MQQLHTQGLCILQWLYSDATFGSRYAAVRMNTYSRSSVRLFRC